MTEKWIAKVYSPFYAWTHNTYFYNYITNSGDGQTHLNTTVVAYDASTYTLNNPSDMTGAAIQVPGSAGAYQHAIIVTEQQGPARSAIYYCAHTTDAKYVKLGDTWPSSAIRVILPTTMRETTTCTQSNHSYSNVASDVGVDATCNHCGYCRLYIKPNLLNAVKQGKTKTLAATTNLSCYRMAMKVVSPSGSTSWLGNEMNTSSYSKSYTFSEQGLYTITVYARDLNPTVYSSSISTSVTFVVRCY